MIADPDIFITYSSKDQKVARIICTALENRGLTCWISSRDVKPGQNFQEQIVRSIRAAKIMVLVFTANANNSNEIKKELALASQNNLLVIPVRIEDVAPNEAFAYEFATRQWIDLFDDWETSVARLVELIAGAIDDHRSDGRENAGPGLARSAAASSFVKMDMSGAAPDAGLSVPKQRSGLRWVVISGVAILIAAGIAYEAVTSLQQPSSTAVAVSNRSPTQLEIRNPVTSSAPAVPTAEPPSRACLAYLAFTDYDSIVRWSDSHSVDSIRTDVNEMVSRFFACQSLTDAQAYDLFAKMSVLVAQAVPNPSCFDGDAGVVSTNPAVHLSYAQKNGRSVASSGLQWKIGKALACADKDRRGRLFADLEMALKSVSQ